MSTPSIDELLESFWEIRPLLKVAHHIPGRIRLGVSLKGILKRPDMDAGDITRFLESLRGIDEVRLNKAAATAVITYRPKEFPQDLWNVLLTGEKEHADREIRRHLSDIKDE